MTVDDLPMEKQGISTCPKCGKVFYGTGKDEDCFACYLIENPVPEEPKKTKAGAGGWDYYKMPNTIRIMYQKDVVEYLAGCPKSRSVWFDVLHNSATPNGSGIGIPLSFQQYHMSKGWSDIGYHFVITTDGAIYLGRNLVHQGAHAFAEGNRGSMGFCLVGDFSGSGGLPSVQQTDSARFLVQSVGGAFGYTNHTGHRFVADPNIPSHSTSCPGNNVSLAMIKQWTSGVAPVPPKPKEDEDMVYGKEFMSADGKTFDFPNCWRDKHNYFVFTSGSWTDLKFEAIDEKGNSGKTTNGQTDSLKNKVHNMQDIMGVPEMAKVKGSYRLIVTSASPCQISLREALKVG